MRKKILIGFFVVTLVLDYFYGALLYSKVFGKDEAYSIGKFCAASRVECEHTYFKAYLDKIDSISNESRSFFSSIFIKEDQAGYTGNCPCPYNQDSRGYSCGGRSSYSKSGRISYCYDSDVSGEQVAAEKIFLLAQAKDNLDNAVAKDLGVYHEHYTLLLVLIIYGILFLRLRRKKPIK